jgi:hypothetical protein
MFGIAVSVGYAEDVRQDLDRVQKLRFERNRAFPVACAASRARSDQFAAD